MVIIEMKKRAILLYTLPLIILFPLFCLSCSCKGTPLEGEVTFLVGTMKINSTYASVGSRVIKGDTLVTDEKTEAVIQLRDSAVITLKSNTEIIFDSLSDGSCGSGTASLVLNKGTSLHKVIKSGSEYSVKAPTAVASVRGTEFEMTADETRTIIKVTSGTVYVRKVSENTRADKSVTDSQNKGVEEIILREGDSLQIYTLGAGASGHSDRSITGVPGKEKSEKKSGKTGTVKKDKTASVKTAKKTSSKSRAVSEKKQAVRKDKTAASGSKASGKSAAAVKKSDTTAGTKKSDKSAGSAETGKAAGTEKKDSKQSQDSIAESDNASTDRKTDVSKKDNGTSSDKKESYTTDAANKKSSYADRKSQKRTDGSTTDSGSGSDKISKSTDIAGGKEKAPDPDAVRALVNKKNRSINDIRKVYNRIDRLHLYSGKVITGAITERGDPYTIITTEGLIKIPRKDIQSNDIIK